MTSSSNGGKPFPNVPPPAGARQGSAYTRFIPREELGDFERWKPGSIDSAERHSAQRARDRVPPTVDEWQAMVGEARQEGYQEGYRDGLVALENFKQSFTAQTSAQLGALVASFDQQFEEMEARMAQAVARTAVLLARQVLRMEIACRPEVVAALAQDALNSVQASARHVVVHVHPDDHALVAEGAAELLTARGARLVADGSISRGGCVIRSDADLVDSTLETRWSHAAASMGVQLPWLPAPPPAAGGEGAA
jgi:flagellar assembly protein FliH